MKPHYHDFAIQEEQHHNELKQIWPGYIKLVKAKTPHIWTSVLIANIKRMQGMPYWQKVHFIKAQSRVLAHIPDSLWTKIKTFVGMK